MRQKREKGYWIKRKETFTTGAKAKERAGNLRNNEHTAHVVVNKTGEDYIVEYSVARWYYDELLKTGIKL